MEAALTAGMRRTSHEIFSGHFVSFVVKKIHFCIRIFSSAALSELVFWWNASPGLRWPDGPACPGLCYFAPSALLSLCSICIRSLSTPKQHWEKAAKRSTDHSPGQAWPSGHSAALGKRPTHRRSPSGATENAFLLKSEVLQ